MSTQHPIIAVTGSSGAGRGPVKEVFNKVIRREGFTAAFVEGASFHRYDRAEMAARRASGLSLSHFAPEANLFDEQEALYRSYAETGSGRRRHYIHRADDALRHGCPELKPGQFTPWEELPDDTDMLVYEGLHGVARHDEPRPCAPMSTSRSAWCR